MAESGRSFGRSVISLDGVWEFAPDDAGTGERERWHESGASYSERITVPGCWQAAGFYCKTAWYRRQVEIPADWQGKRVSLEFGAVSYSAAVWVNGQHALSHEGMITPFDQEIGAYLQPGQTNTIAVRVTQFDYPGVMQTEQVGDKLLGVNGCWTVFGGLYQSVGLVATAPVWLDDLFLIPDVDKGFVTARVRVRNETCEARALDVEARVVPDSASVIAEPALTPSPSPAERERGAEGGVRAAAATSVTVAAGAESVVDLPIPLPDAILWDPDNPFLYRARVAVSEGGQEIDAVSDRFGMRKVEVRGKEILLNNRPIFLRGWLCDAVYPEQISPTPSAEHARRIVAVCKEHGFNFVRHHTHLAPPAFHDTCDELGLLQLEEFASFGSIGRPRLDPTQKTHREIHATWRGMIERDRNHPSVIAYGMTNECWTRSEFQTWAPTYRDLYEEGRALDPTRLIVDNSGGEDRWSVASDLYDKHTYHFPSRKEMVAQAKQSKRPYLRGREAYYNADLSKVEKPCIVTEVGGWCSFPDFDQIRAASGGGIPWWASRDPVRNPKMAWDAFARIEAGIAGAGLADRYPEIIANSERYARMGNKLQVEQMRLASGLVGYAYCAFMDCYTWTCGVVDNYLRPKSYAQDFAAHNQATVLLWPRERWCYRMGEELRVPLVVSHYGTRPFENARLTWRLLVGDEALLEGRVGSLDAACYRVQDLTTVALRLPELPQSTHLGLAVSLEDASQAVGSSWDLWAFDRREVETGGQTVALFDPENRQPKLRERFQFVEAVAQGEVSRADVLVATRLSAEVVRYLEGGGRVLWLESGDELNCRPYTPRPIVDYHSSLVNPHSVTAAFPNEGWLDLQFHNLMGTAALDTGYFPPDRLTPVVEVLHAPYSTLYPQVMAFRRKGFVVEAGVGAGRLLATSFVLDGLGELPEADAMAKALLEHLLCPAAAPAYTLTGDELREWAWGSARGERRVEHADFHF